MKRLLMLIENNSKADSLARDTINNVLVRLETVERKYRELKNLSPGPYKIKAESGLSYNSSEERLEIDPPGGQRRGKSHRGRTPVKSSQHIKITSSLPGQINSSRLYNHSPQIVNDFSMYDTAGQSPLKDGRQSNANVNIMPAAFSNDSTQINSVISPKDPN